MRTLSVATEPQFTKLACGFEAGVMAKHAGMFPVLCAWCGRMIRLSPAARSHGVCLGCKAALLARRRRG